MRTLVVGMLIACDAGLPTSPPASGPAPPSQAATSFAATFDPAVVGALAPRTVEAGAYSMALDMTFDLFMTMELHMTASRHGVLLVTLAADGSAHGCVASRGDEGAEGQYHYESDPAKRQPYRGTSDSRIGALRGHWKTTDGIAELTFDQVAWGDRLAWGICDPTKALPVATPIVELRCIATAKTSTLPAGALACRSTRDGDPVGLGMPFGPPPPKTERPMQAPTGTQLVLAPGGITVTYSLADRASGGRTIHLAPGAVAIDPAQFAK